VRERFMDGMERVLGSLEGWLLDYLKGEREGLGRLLVCIAFYFAVSCDDCVCVVV